MYGKNRAKVLGNAVICQDSQQEASMPKLIRKR